MVVTPQPSAPGRGFQALGRIQRKKRSQLEGAWSSLDQSLWLLMRLSTSNRHALRYQGKETLDQWLCQTHW